MGAQAVVLVHGAGRDGRAAWPRQHELEQERTCLFLERVAPGDPPAVVVAHLAKRLDTPVHVVAHSYGALPALLLADRYPDRVASLVLAEPAALSLTVRQVHTRAHMEAVGPVLDTDGSVPAREFAERLAQAQGTGVPPMSERVLTETVAHLRAMTPPWRVPVPADVVGRVPTLVAIGARGTMYEEVAAALEQRGARVLLIPDSGHRPQDTDAFTAAMVQHWAVVERSR